MESMRIYKTDIPVEKGPIGNKNIYLEGPIELYEKALVMAVKTGDKTRLKRLVAQVNDQVNGESQGSQQDDPELDLLLAALQGRTDEVKRVVGEWPGKTPLASINQAGGAIALMLAARYAHVEVVKLLMKAGASPDAADWEGGTALIFASQKGHVEVVQLLLEAGASPDAADSQGMTALAYAEEQGHEKVVAYLRAPELQPGEDATKDVSGDEGKSNSGAEGKSKSKGRWRSAVKRVLGRGASNNNSSSNSRRLSSPVPFRASDFRIDVADLKLGHLIREGTNSRVFQADYFGDVVCVKTGKQPAGAMGAYLMRELSLIRDLQHPNLQRYIGAGLVLEKGWAAVASAAAAAAAAAMSDPRSVHAVYIVSEFAAGGDLRSMLLGPDPLGWKIRVRIAQGVARGLAYLHSKNIIHRNVKAEKILLTAAREPLISDFSSARCMPTRLEEGEDEDEAAGRMTLHGTARYIQLRPIGH